MAPVYSICITNYNTIDTIKESLESILDQIDERFEVIVVDNYSTDGSREILENYARQGKIKLILEKCTRGRGRQIAFENSHGDYIISGLDMDDVFYPVLKEILKIYHSKYEGCLGLIKGQISPRWVAEAIGWKDLQSREDMDYIRRASRLVPVVELYPMDKFVKIGKNHWRKNLINRARERFVKYLCMYELKENPWEVEIKYNPWYDKFPLIIIAILAKVWKRVHKAKNNN
ncbi:MAG: glycosyltransferase family 2 protein [Nitrososphaeria archaeon]